MFEMTHLYDLLNLLNFLERRKGTIVDIDMVRIWKVINFVQIKFVSDFSFRTNTKI